MTEWPLSSFHKKSDNAELCAHRVFTDHDWRSHQCSRKRGYGPEQAYCKQHSPEAKAARKAKSDAKYEAERQRWARKEAAEKARTAALAACIAIVEGHNDPRALAAAVIAMLPEDE